MRTVKVVDASALACFCFDEPEITAIRRDLSDADLFAPAILDFEMANICWKRLRKWPDATEQTLRQFAIRKRMPITIRDVSFDGVVDLAMRTGLSAYDASYLWLARRLDAELVTLDAKLSRAAHGETG